MAYNVDQTFQSASIVGKLVPPEEGIVVPQDSLSLELDDKELVKRINKKVKDIRNHYKKSSLYERRKKNETYRFGRQIQEQEEMGDLKDYESRNVDNVLYEIESTIKPLAMSQLPDLIVTPGNQSTQSRNTASLLSKVVDTQIKERENRKVLGLALMHRSVYFVGIIKAIWDPEAEGGMGDGKFVVIHPDLVDIDYTNPDPNKVTFFSQIVPMTVESALMRFPKAKNDLITELKKRGLMGKARTEPNGDDLATEIKTRENWFIDYKKVGEKYEKVWCLVWKFEDVILGKMKNPNFDYEGHETLFSYEVPGVESSRRALSVAEMQQSMLSGQYPPNVTKKTVYNNYFSEPEMPFYLVTYDQWGKNPIDETTELEQNIRNQETLDKRVKNINETLQQRGHTVWSKETGMTPADIEKMDLNNPKQDYMVNGNPNQQFAYIQPPRPTPDEYKDADMIRNRMYAISGSTAVRGTLQTDVATSNQIAREANYTRADDLVDETINPAAEWMARWQLQFIKLRYTKEHFRWLAGAKGEFEYYKLHQNMIEDGMVVKIKASGTDKLKAQNNALNLAKMGTIDPLSLFRDMGYDDAETRTVMLMSFKSNPAAYLESFLKDDENVTPDLLAKVQAMAPQPPAPEGGAAPQNPTPTNTAAAPVAPPPQPQPLPQM